MHRQINLLGLLGFVLLSSLGCTKHNTPTSSNPVPMDTTKPVATARNPVITNRFTADPAALVYGDSVYLFTGHDEAAPNVPGYVMRNWLCYSSADMKTWKDHPAPLQVGAFGWAKGDAWASQVIERDGKFYWYVAVEHNATHPGKAIGVAVADKPWGPYRDAKGAALVTNDMTPDINIRNNMSWDDIDPTVWIENGQAYLYWGNSACYWAKLKPNMVELDGPIHTVTSLPSFTEAPYIHKRGGWFYLSYATLFPEKIGYAMSRSIEGPWVYKGILNELAPNCNTNHQSIIEYKGKWYFIYHHGKLQPDGGDFRRSVCIDYLYYNADSTLKPVVMTDRGVDQIK